jgi:molybdopterin molybdotransferase
MFFKLKTSEEIVEILKDFEPSEEETISIEHALGRVLSRDIISREDLPGFTRSTMDGYAVIAKDSFGATEAVPAFFEVAGEVMMGKNPTISLLPGQAIKISTGGMLPENSDSVVMLEYSRPLDEKTIEIYRAVSPLENVILPEDDISRGECVLKKRHRLRPQDLGLLTGLGFTEAAVFTRPKVAIISTGDEVVPIHTAPEPGQIRDINSYTLNALCLNAGAEPVMLGICNDNFNELKAMVQQGLSMADTVWISGGSSVGTRDMTIKVFESFDNMEILAHGISVSPGKPTIIAKINSKAFFGLPGHVTSALVIAEIFLVPFLKRLSGEDQSFPFACQHLEAELARNINSSNGRDDYIRVRLHLKDGRLVAEPVFGKSGLISSLIHAHGLLLIDRNTEGLYQGQKVKVRLFSSSAGRGIA